MGKVILGLTVALAFVSGAYADMVSPGFSFSGSQQSLTATLTASGSATLGGSGTYYSWVGWPVSTWASVSISMNNQTVGIGTNPDTIAIDKDPMGNATVAFERLTLSNGQLVDLNVTDLFGGSPQGVALDQVALDGEVIGLVPVQVRLDVTGSASNFSFDMTAPAWTLPQGGAHPSLDYLWIGSGNANIDYNLAVDGELEVAGIFTVDLGTLTNLSGSTGYTGIPLIGSMNLTELAGPYPKDVAVHISSNFNDWTPITVPFTTAGAYDYNNYSGEGGTYYKVHFDYDFTGSLTVDNVTLDIYSTLNDIVPEPISLAVFGIGAGLLTVIRRRQK
jgi:hypothetical protein